MFKIQSSIASNGGPICFSLVAIRLTLTIHFDRQIAAFLLGYSTYTLFSSTYVFRFLFSPIFLFDDLNIYFHSQDVTILSLQNMIMPMNTVNTVNTMNTVYQPSDLLLATKSTLNREPFLTLSCFSHIALSIDELHFIQKLIALPNPSPPTSRSGSHSSLTSSVCTHHVTKI